MFCCGGGSGVGCGGPVIEAAVAIMAAAEAEVKRAAMKMSTKKTATTSMTESPDSFQ